MKVLEEDGAELNAEKRSARLFLLDSAALGERSFVNEEGVSRFNGCRKKRVFELIQMFCRIHMRLVGCRTPLSGGLIHTFHDV